MAGQFFHQWFGYFRLDLHGCRFESALKIAHKRLDECYTYGIRFLEIVHGRDEKAKSRHRSSLGKILEERISHPKIRNTVQLNAYGSPDWNGSATAIRFCLHENPNAEERMPGIVFEGYKPEFTYEPSYVLKQEPVWSFGTNDIRPFAPIWVSVQDVIEAILGEHPTGSSAKRTDSGYWDHQAKKIPTQTILDSLAEVYELPEFSQLVEHSTEFFDLSVAQFESAKKRSLRGLVTTHEAAEYAGCPLWFVEWCECFLHTAQGCRCIEPLGDLTSPLLRMDLPVEFRERSGNLTPSRRGMHVNALNGDGTCIKERCFLRGSETVIKSLWQEYHVGAAATRFANGIYGFYEPDSPVHFDVNPGYLAMSHCAGKGCSCAFNATCRQRPKLPSEARRYEINKAALEFLKRGQ